MSSETLLLVLFRWMHILAAVVAIGGVFFMRFVLMPSAHVALDEPRHAALRAALLPRWRRWIMICIGLLIVSGLYNFVVLSLPRAKEAPLYHPLFGVKVIIALVIFFLASALTGRSKAFEGLRSKPRTWVTLNVLLGIVVILISGILKNLPGPR